MSCRSTWHNPTAVILPFSVRCSKSVTGIEWSRDGRTLVSGALDGHVIVWHVEEGTHVRNFVRFAAMHTAAKRCT